MLILKSLEFFNAIHLYDNNNKNYSKLKNI